MLPLQFSRKKATRKPLMTLSLPSAAFGLERWKGNQECRLQITSGDSISGLDTRQKRRSRWWSRENEKDSSICSLQYLKLQMHVFYSGCSFLLLSILQKSRPNFCKRRHSLLLFSKEKVPFSIESTLASYQMMHLMKSLEFMGVFLDSHQSLWIERLNHLSPSSWFSEKATRKSRSRKGKKKKTRLGRRPRRSYFRAAILLSEQGV